MRAMDDVLIFNHLFAYYMLRRFPIQLGLDKANKFKVPYNIIIVAMMEFIHLVITCKLADNNSIACTTPGTQHHHHFMLVSAKFTELYAILAGNLL